MSMVNLSGKEVADIAYAQPSIEPRGLGLAIEILIYIFTVLCAIVVGLRIWVRTWREESKQTWRINDYLAVAGFVSGLLPKSSQVESRCPRPFPLLFGAFTLRLDR